jgi:hypothetical protein
MTDISNWNYYYKLTPSRVLNDSNMLYSPKVNPEGNVMCMHYCQDQVYRPGRELIDQELIGWFFNREIRFLQELSNLNSTPKIYEIDTKNKCVFIEWNKETLSQIIFDDNRNIDNELPNWKTQIYNILKDFKQKDYYKLALYPHCFYISIDGELKTIDYYSVVPVNERYIERKIIESIIGKEGAYRFDQSTENGIIDFKKFFEITVRQHLTNYWPNSPFPNFFEEIYLNDQLEQSNI